MTALLGAFDYDDLPEQVATRLRGQADRIRARNAGIVEAMIETGRDLLAVKGSIPHGTFAQWVEIECGLSPRMAQLYMQASTWAEGENAKLISHFQPTALMKVAAKSTPDEVRQTFVEQARQGVAVSTKEVDAALKAARGARPRAIAAQAVMEAQCSGTMPWPTVMAAMEAFCSPEPAGPEHDVSLELDDLRRRLAESEAARTRAEDELSHALRDIEEFNSAPVEEALLREYMKGARSWIEFGKTIGERGSLDSVQERAVEAFIEEKINISSIRLMIQYMAFARLSDHYGAATSEYCHGGNRIAGPSIWMRHAEDLLARGVT